MKLIKLGLASILAAGALYAGTYNVDSSHSNVGFKVKHMMISNISGRFDTFSGSFEYDEKTKQIKSLNGSIVDPWGNTRVGLALYGKISRDAFGLKYNSVLESGGVVVGDKVKLSIEIEGILAK